MKIWISQRIMNLKYTITLKWNRLLEYCHNPLLKYNLYKLEKRQLYTDELVKQQLKEMNSIIKRLNHLEKQLTNLSNNDKKELEKQL